MKTKQILSFFILLVFTNSCMLRSLATLTSSNLVEEQKQEVIMNFEDSYGLILLPVVIEGKTYRFVFDTGAGSTVVSEEIAALTSFKKKGGVKVNDAYESMNKLPVGTLAEISIGSLSYSKVGVIVSNFNKSEQFKCLRIDGILGMNILKLHNWKIDYDKKQIVAYQLEKEMIVPENSKTFGFVNKVGTPFIELSVDNKRDKFMVDTGKNSDLISVSPEVQLNGKKQLSVGQSSFGMFGKAVIDSTYYVKVHFSDTNGFDLKDVIVTQTKNNRSNLGNGFLKKNYQYVLFDFNNRRIHCCEPRNVENAYFSYGIAAIISNDNLIVGEKNLLLEGMVNEINVSDTILEVNGVRVNKENICGILESFTTFKREKKSIYLRLKRDTKEFEVTLTLEEIGE